MKLPAAAAVLLLCATGMAQDTIVKTDGSEVTGIRIEEETFQTVTYKKANLPGTQEVATANVREIRYGRTSPLYIEAQKDLADGNMRSAAEALVAAADDQRAADNLRALARVEAADLLLDQTFYDDASAQYDQLLSEFPKTRHLARALLGKGRAALGAGRYGDAQSTLQSLQSQAQSKGLGEQWAMSAEYYALLVGQLQGKTDGLAAGYQALQQKAAANYPGIANQCALQLGRLEFAADDYAGAEHRFGAIIDGRLTTSREAVAGAYNGRGRCRFELAQATLSKGVSLESPEAQKAYQDALLDFLRVHVHYPEIQAEQAESLYWAARCLQNLTSLPDHEARARYLFKRCREEYPTSPWASEAASS